MSFGPTYSATLGNSLLTSPNGLAADAQSLGNLKAQADKSTPQAIKETAKQFESLFMRELMKSMREASIKSGMLDSAGGDLGTDLLDQQFAVQMSGQPGGLSELIAQQLTRQMGANVTDKAVTTGQPPKDAGSTERPLKKLSGEVQGTTARPTRAPTENQVNFVRKHSDIATKIEKATGIPASFMLGQAGHETGWGQHQIKLKGGAPSFNLFGIKAGAGWTGKVAEITTTEFVDGAPQKRIAKFRAYDSYEDSFKDYARLITESPRYAKARLQTASPHAFANGLQKAGYASDPDYAAKLSRAINTTLQLRRVQV